MRPIYHVFSKEMREMMRDKRVRFGAFGMPIFLVVFIVMLLGLITTMVGKDKSIKVHVVGSSNPMANLLNKKFTVEKLDTEAAGEKLIKDGKATLVVSFEPKPVAGAKETVRLLLDEKEERSNIAKAQLMGVLQPEIAKRVAGVLVASNVDPNALNVVDLKEVPVNVGEGPGAGGALVSMVPYLIVLFAFTGGLSIASDLVAGEKEKSTLETLLITPVRRSEIVLGKFLAIGAVCLMSSLSALVGLAVVSVIKLPGSEILFKNGLGITPKAIILTLILLLPLVALFASLLVAVSSFARNSREAQTYLGLLNLVVVMPAVFSQLIGLTDFGQKLWINFIPILNTANGIRNALLGKAAFLPMVITISVSAALAAIGIWAALWLFNREQVLSRL